MKLLASLLLALALAEASPIGAQGSGGSSRSQKPSSSQAAPAQASPSTPDAAQNPPATNTPLAPPGYKPDFQITRDKPTPTTPAPTSPVSPSYTIGPQDQLSITVYDETELTGKYRVDTDGMLTFPLLGRIPAAGFTLAELQTRLTAMLANGYIRNPQVRVDMDQYKSQSVFVMGEVRTPGKITMSGSSMTLLEALAAAGSPTSSASNDITVMHPKRPNTSGTAPAPDADQDGETIHVNLRNLLAAQLVVLQDGDIVTVPKAQTFYISGFVRNAGSYVYEPGMTLQQAVTLAGGLNERGTYRGAYATRTINGKPTEVRLEEQDKIMPNDTITIKSRLF